MYYSESGDEWKKFNTRDGMGIKLLQKAGLITAIVTQERTRLVARRAEKIGDPEVHQGVIRQVIGDPGHGDATWYLAPASRVYRR